MGQNSTKVSGIKRVFKQYLALSEYVLEHNEDLLFPGKKLDSAIENYIVRSNLDEFDAMENEKSPEAWIMSCHKTHFEFPAYRDNPKLSDPKKLKKLLRGVSYGLRPLLKYIFSIVEDGSYRYWMNQYISFIGDVGKNDDPNVIIVPCRRAEFMWRAHMQAPDVYSEFKAQEGFFEVYRADIYIEDRENKRRREKKEARELAKTIEIKATEVKDHHLEADENTPMLEG